MEKLANNGLEMKLNHHFIMRELDLVESNGSNEDFQLGVKIGLFMGNRKAYAHLLLQEALGKTLTTPESTFLKAMKDDELKLFGSNLDAKETLL